MPYEYFWANIYSYSGELLSNVPLLTGTMLDTSAYCGKIISTSDGGFVVGHSRTTGGSTDWTKFDSKGNKVWTITTSGNSQNETLQIEELANGNILIPSCGHIINVYDSAGNNLKEITIEEGLSTIHGATTFMQIVATDDGGFYALELESRKSFKM